MRIATRTGSGLPLTFLSLAFLSLALFSLASLLVPASALAQAFRVDAGPDVVLECDSQNGASYTLNGTVPDGPNVTFDWTTDPAVMLENASTLTPTGVFPVGATTVTLSAMDSVAGLSGSDSATVTVQDTEPPVVKAYADPMVLWPPNHQLRDVKIHLRLKDACTSTSDLQVSLVSVVSNEPDSGGGSGNTTSDIQNADIGTDDREVSLRAERAGSGNGRVYTLTYDVTDLAGNTTEAEAKVYVPHDFSHVRDRIHKEMDGDRAAMDNICPRPDDAADQFVQGLPKLGTFPDLSSCQKACSTWQSGCGGVVSGATSCVLAEEKAIAGLNVSDCWSFGDRRARKICRKQQKSMGVDTTLLRQQNTAGNATCDDTNTRCEDACSTLFDPNGPAYDNMP